MNHTTNYQLSQWEAGDKVQRVDFNADNAKIDGAIKAVDTLARSKADTSALNALSQTVAGHAAALALRGNCQIWTTTYQGSGKCGKNNPTRVVFPQKPLLAMIYVPGGGTPAWMLPCNGPFLTPDSNWLTWSGSTASWYTETTQPEKQLNHSDSQYVVLALIPMDQ